MASLFQCDSPTSENMSATMLAFILRSRGASLKNVYFFGKERERERELKDVQRQPHEPTAEK